MAAKYIFATLAAGFLIAALFGRASPQAQWRLAHKTWLLVGLIFAAASLWLAYRDGL